MAAPQIISHTEPPPGTYSQGENITVTVTFDQVVNVSGGLPVPTIPRTIASGSADLVYQGGSATDTLVFMYTVLEGDDGTGGMAASYSISLNGATIKNDGLESANLVTMSGPSFPSVIVFAAVPGYTLIGDDDTITASKGAAFSYRLYSKVNGHYQNTITWNPIVLVRATDPSATIPIVPYVFDDIDASSTGHLFTGLVFNAVGPHTLTFVSLDPDGIYIRYPVSVDVGITATKIVATVVRRSGRTTQIALSATDAAGDVDFSNTATITITSSAPAFVNVTATSDTESFVAGQALITVSSAAGNTITFSAPGLTSATVNT